MSTNIQGLALIGGEAVRGAGKPFRAFDPGRQQAIDPEFNAVDTAQVAEACALAGAAFDSFRLTSDQERAGFLEQVAAQILALGDALIERAMAETGLPRARLEGERGRTVNQLKLFAELLREGSWQDARIDTALPARTPPRPDLRLRFIGVGPVAVFGASNFPLAFSVAGGDTAAAFAAGCPVVVKAHSAHPGTSELVGRAIVEAVRLCNLPAGTFALLTGSGHGIGDALVRHPAIQAVGFTGSRSGGLALMATAAARPQPIPVYAEMS
ncbi:MAG TPA: aldehyde dehydrogenase family protein, partial [Burkholderiaceae bacterium]|nr:aldehyde dehydrogenase family protein [Burkholderiaceae bacterium]